MTTRVLVLVAAFLAYMLWSRTRRIYAEFEIAREDGLPCLLRSMAGLTWGHVTEGNAVEIVQNSSFFDVLLHDIARARHSVHLETFLWRDGSVSDRVSRALCDAAGRGIGVRVLVDQRGAKQTSPEVWAGLRRAGCEFRVYHRARFREFGLYNHRDHRKIVVVDGRIGYTFGHGIADMWGGTAENPTGWRDTAARIEGPVVNDLQAAFFDNWTATGGRAAAGDAYFPALRQVGSTPLHVAYLRPPETTSGVRRVYDLAIAAARREIIIQNPYFLPGPRAMALFAAAVRRGVAVSIMLPTAETSDFSIVQHASHQHYGPLLDLGVRIYEHTVSGLHQKVMIVDRQWFSIGSTNFDPRSFRINEEITVAGVDDRVAAELVAAWDADVKNASPWTPERWRARTPGHKWIDRGSALMRRQL